VRYRPNARETVAVTLPAQSSPDATSPSDAPSGADVSDQAPPLPEVAPVATSRPDPDRGLSSPAAFIGVVAVTTLVIILCVLGATMSGLFGLIGSESGTQAAATSPPALEQRGPVTTFDDGQWLIGTDIEAGTYATTVPAGSAGCTWERKDSTDGTANSVLESGIGTEGERLVVDIKSTDQVFGSVGCGLWQRAD
jgi:hypothetical protein